MALFLHKAQTKCYYLMGALELVISILVIIGIIVRLTGLPYELGQLASEGMSG